MKRFNIIFLIMILLVTCGLSPGVKKRLRGIDSEERSTTRQDSGSDNDKKKKEEKGEGVISENKPIERKRPAPPSRQSTPPKRRSVRTAQQTQSTSRQSPSRQKIYASPQPVRYRIRIETVPEGAVVLMGGKRIIDETNGSAWLGERKKTRITVRHPAYKPVMIEFACDRNRVFYIDFSDSKPFIFKSDPAGARVTVDGEEYGETPLSTYEVDPGMIHTVFLELGMNRKEIVYSPGDSKSLNVDLNYGSVIVNLPESGMSFNYLDETYPSGSRIRSIEDEAEIIVDCFGYEYTTKVLTVRRKELTVYNLDVPGKKMGARITGINKQPLAAGRIELAKSYEIDLQFNTPCRARVELIDINESRKSVLAKGWDITMAENTVFWKATKSKSITVKPGRYYELLVTDEVTGNILISRKVRFVRNICSIPFGSVTGEPGLAFAADFEVVNTEDGFVNGRGALLYSDEDDGSYAFGLGNLGYYVYPYANNSILFGVSGNFLHVNVPGEAPLYKMDAKMIASLQLFNSGYKLYWGSAVHVRYSFGEEINPDDQPIRYAGLAAKPEVILSLGAGLGPLKVMGNVSLGGRAGLGVSYKLSSRFIAGLSVAGIKGSSDVPAAIEFAVSPARNLTIGPTILLDFFRNDQGRIEYFSMIGLNFRYSIDY